MHLKASSSLNRAVGVLPCGQVLHLKARTLSLKLKVQLYELCDGCLLMPRVLHPIADADIINVNRNAALKIIIHELHAVYTAAATNAASERGSTRRSADFVIEGPGTARNSMLSEPRDGLPCNVCVREHPAFRKSAKSSAAFVNVTETYLRTPYTANWAVDVMPSRRFAGSRGLRRWSSEVQRPWTSRCVDMATRTLSLQPEDYELLSRSLL